MKSSFGIHNLGPGRGFGVTSSPYKGWPKFQAHRGYNFGLNRMQGVYDLYAFGLHLWLVW